MTSLEIMCRRGADPLRVITATTLVVALASHDGGTALHAVVGGLFAAAAAGHVLASARWIRAVAGRAGHGLPLRVAIDAVLDVLMVTLVAGVTATGLAALASPSPGRATGLAAGLHGGLASALALIVAVHVGRHWRGRRRRRKAARARRGRTGPSRARGLGAGPPSARPATEGVSGERRLSPEPVALTGRGCPTAGGFLAGIRPG